MTINAHYLPEYKDKTKHFLYYVCPNNPNKDDFMKLMIPLTTALITTYFALLKFIGIETMNTVAFGQSYLGPPFLMLISLIAFIIGAFPVRKGLNINDPESIKSFRDAAMDWKYTSCIFGSAFFLFGIGLMIYLIGFPPSSS